MVTREDLRSCKRIVVKVGTSTITHESGQLNLLRMESLARVLSDLHNQGRDVVLISSGAVGAGAGRMGIREKPRTLPLKQAMAAVGQATLMQMYEKFFSEYGKTIAQVLLTREAFERRLRYLNGRNTLRKLLELGVIPIINENDTVAVDEIKFGDNDTLSALVACTVDADLLVILSDIDGLYNDDPRTNRNARLIPEIREITDDIRAHSTHRGAAMSSGGMFTKLSAADIVMPAGIPMVIASGSERGVVRRILDGENLGTLFIPWEERRHARKQWIAFGGMPQGRIFVDDGAASALRERGRSLLPSGVIRVDGVFERGKVVSVIAPDGGEMARGLANYDSEEISRIAGRRTDEIDALLGSKDYDEVIHRDNLVLV